jgi:hypothetical protein
VKRTSSIVRARTALWLLSVAVEMPLATTYDTALAWPCLALRVPS